MRARGGPARPCCWPGCSTASAPAGSEPPPPTLLALAPPQRSPQLLCLVGRIEVAAAEGVGDGVGDGGQRADRAALTHALRAERVARRGARDLADRDRRRSLCREQGVIDERRGPELAVLVVDRLLDQALAETLDGSADDLAVRE